MCSFQGKAHKMMKYQGQVKVRRIQMCNKGCYGFIFNHNTTTITRKESINISSALKNNTWWLH